MTLSRVVAATTAQPVFRYAVAGSRGTVAVLPEFHRFGWAQVVGRLGGGRAPDSIELRSSNTGREASRLHQVFLDRGSARLSTGQFENIVIDDPAVALSPSPLGTIHTSPPLLRRYGVLKGMFNSYFVHPQARRDLRGRAVEYLEPGGKFCRE